jgi:hypothetical protein
MNKEDLQKFCYNDDDGSAGVRRAIQMPFSRGLYTYATDGKELIRVPRLEDVPEEIDAPDVEKIWPKENYEFFNIPNFTEPEFKLCPTCKGTGTYDYGEINEEEGCGGIGVCYKCEGDKTFPDTKHITIGCSVFSDHLLWKIKDLPNIKIAPTEKLKAALLKFDGGDGLIMPMNA